ncbi:MAG: short-chain dehydrogenase/reductase [Acidimicrobiales bacterium]|nr:short-chain dehydrogenase/reductase [Acidimicrobiales bacterium]
MSVSTSSATPPVAIVTGGSRGLGRALVAGLLDHGWSVVTDGRDPDRLADAAAELSTATGDLDRLVALAGDVEDERHLDDLVAAADRLGRLDLVVLNAGGLGPSPLPRLAELDPTALVELFAVNAVAPLRLVQRALPALRANRGTVVAVTSDAAAEAYEGWGAYGATKAALEHLARVLAAEEPEVTVHRIDPGDLRTDMHQAAFPGEDISDRPPPEVAVPGILRIVAERRPSGQRWAAQAEVPA